jgi:hypothetical protein
METTSEKLIVAKTIVSQIGNKALYMMGACNISGDENGVNFKIKGSKFSHIRITLNGLDLYDISFIKVHGYSIKKENVENVYAEDMHRIIESKTGLCLSL